MDLLDKESENPRDRDGEFNKTKNIPNPVDGKYIFQVDPNIRVRFNADGWVEEIGKGGEEDSMGVRLQGLAGSRLDDVYARRFYDLYARVVIFDLHPKRVTEQAAAAGLLTFRELEADSQIYSRVQKIIAIGNHHFNLNVKPLA